MHSDTLHQAIDNCCICVRNCSRHALRYSRWLADACNQTIALLHVSHMIRPFNVAACLCQTAHSVAGLASHGPASHGLTSHGVLSSTLRYVSKHAAMRIFHHRFQSLVLGLCKTFFVHPQVAGRHVPGVPSGHPCLTVLHQAALLAACPDLRHK